MKRTLIALLAALLLLTAAAQAEVPCSYYSAHGDHDWCHTQDTLVNPPYGHSWVDTGAGQEPTCTDVGWRVEECQECGKERNRELPKTEHNWVHVGYDTPSTCTEKGWRMEECANCGQIRTYELPLVDHEYGDWMLVQMATDHSAGLRARVCKVCGNEETHIYYLDGTLYRGGPSGAPVAEMQQMLIDLHYLVDVADGSFGKKTEQAVVDFQKAAGLETTGIAYPQTLAALAAEWQRHTGGAPGFPAQTGGEAPPCCVRTPETEGVGVDFCAVHAALWAEEYNLRSQAFADDAGLEALRACVSLWLEEIDGLYTQWEGRLAEADKPLALEARNAFAAMLDAQTTALASAYGEDSPQTLLFELDLLHEQATTLCGFLNMNGE